MGDFLIIRQGVVIVFSNTMTIAKCDVSIFRNTMTIAKYDVRMFTVTLLGR